MNIYTINSKEFFIGSKVLDLYLSQKIISLHPYLEGNKLSNILSKLTSKKYCNLVYKDLVSSRLLDDTIFDPYIFLRAYIGNVYIQNKNEVNIDIEKIINKFMSYLYDVLSIKNIDLDILSNLDKYTQEKYNCLPFFRVQKLKNNKYKISLYIKDKYITSIEDSSILHGKKNIAKKILSQK